MRHKSKGLIFLSIILALTFLFSSVSVFAVEGKSWEKKADLFTARREHSVAVFNNKIYAIGGYGAGKSVEEYNPATNGWLTKASMNYARDRHQVAVVGEKIYVIGGRNGENYLNSVEEYDPAKDTWTKKASMKYSRGLHQLAVIGTKIYAIGGYNGTDSRNVVEEYDILTNTWTVKTPMPTARHRHQVAVIDNKIYVIGGNSSKAGKAVNTVEEYNPATNEWTSHAGMSTARDRFQLIVAGRKIYAIGGQIATDKYINSVEEFNIDNYKWSTKDAMNVARSQHSAVYINGKIYAIGGYNDTTMYLNSVEEYNPETDIWITKEDMPTSRDNLEVAKLNGKIYAIGGRDANNEKLKSVEVYTPVPVAPTLAATQGNTAVSLSWNIVSDAPSYNIKRATTSGGPYTSVATVWGNTHTDYNLANGTTYYYVVSAVNTSGESINSNQVAVTPTLPVPSVPSNLKALGGNSMVSLSWDLSSNATSYNIKRSTTSGGSYSTITTISGNTYTDNNLSNGIKYYYVVTAKNAGGESGNSNQAEATPTLPVPSVPLNLKAISGNNTISLNWNSALNATGYNIKRSTTAGGPYTQIATFSGNTYIDNNVSNWTTYYYVVSAVNSGGESGNSNQAEATPKLPIPNVPLNLKATSGNSTISLSWDSALNATSYIIKRSRAEEGPYTQIATASENSYTDNEVTNWTTYYYVVSAVNSGGESGNSNQAEATPKLPIPNVPLNLKATSGNSTISLSWDSALNATSYIIKRSRAEEGPYTQIATASENSYTDNEVTNWTTYYYVVSAVNKGGESENSNKISETPKLPMPGVPSDLKATAGDSMIRLSWDSVLKATSYIIKRSEAEEGSYTQIATVSENSYTDNEVTNETTYYYVVSAINEGGESENSMVAVATPKLSKPSIPSNLKATAGDSMISLSWDSALNATSYIIKRSEAKEGSYTQIATVSENSYTDNEVTNETTYYYVVSAINEGGESENSMVAVATPKLSKPSIPSNLKATAGDSMISLSWDSALNATSYIIKRSEAVEGSFTTITTSSAITYIDNELTNGTTYYYVVSAVNEAGETESSNLTAATPKLSIPSIPLNLKATAGDRMVSLSWNSALKATSYIIKRSTTEEGVYTSIATVSENVYTDTKVIYDTIYYYVVCAKNESGESGNSKLVAATPENSKVILEITSVDKAKVGNEITANVVIHNAKNICAEDIEIKFDNTKLELISVAGADGIKIYKKDKIAAGIRRYIIASLGKANAANGDKILIKLNFKAIAAGDALIDITKGRIADNATLEMDIENSNCGEKTIIIEGPNDVNRSGKYTLLDLGIAAWYYGDASADTDTTLYDTDQVINGKIDDGDLAYIVNQILSNN